MALYQDDLGNLYWSDAVGAVIPAPTDAERVPPWDKPFHIHGHRLDSLLWSGRLVGCISLLAALVALVLLIKGGREEAGLFPALSVMIVLIGQMVIVRRTGTRVVPSTALRLLRPQPWGALLLELAGKLSLAIMFSSMTVEFLSADEVGFWRQAGAVLMGCGTLVFLAQAGLFLMSLLRTRVQAT
ncbi:hypothetical protein CHU95_07530 [Niveispirillum lacus]|uniref:Uncharacterized protein n=1 Tax=Niveispirillum lacus TaxID=1981099 RepID=A0A255Z3V0_9PROT|nr:hypothetical protein [Niveispirillum lacus]OYQ35565.1 hypothetical protein CHU95_07530 [Niveispirillum lacus]